jgi:hypothetical protein
VHVGTGVGSRVIPRGGLHGDDAIGVIAAAGEVGVPLRVLVVVPFAHPPGGVGS